LETQGRLIVDLDRLQEGGESYEGETAPGIIDLGDNEGLIEADGGIIYKLRFEVFGTELLAQGSLMQHFKCRCSLCDTPFDLEVKESCFVDSFEINEEISFLDLTNEIREAIILNLPAYPRCSESCKGLCSSCGANLNKSGCECNTDHGSDCWSMLDVLG